MNKENKRCPVMLSSKAKKSYFTFVNTSRLVNERFHVQDDLVHLFDLGTTLLNLRLQRSMGEGGTQTDTNRTLFDEMKEAECISYIQQTYLNNGNYDEEYLKIPLQNFRATIQDYLNIRDKEAINSRKLAIMKALGLRQIQEGRNHFVVHNKYQQEIYDEIECKNEFEEVVELAKKSYKFRVGDVSVRKLLNDPVKYNKFLEVYSEFNFDIDKDENGCTFIYTGDVKTKKNKSKTISSEIDNIFNKSLEIAEAEEEEEQ